MRQAQAGIENLKDKVDSLIVILNDKLEEEVGEDATMLDCFAAADDVLYKACNGIAEIIHTPGLINVDFEDLKTVMGARGTAMMGTATAAGDHRAHEAAERAITCPLLEGANLQGARGLLVYVTASAATMKQSEVREVMSIMKNFVSKDAIQIVGTAFDNDMGEELRVTVVATGLDTPESEAGVATAFKPFIINNAAAVAAKPVAATTTPEPAVQPQVKADIKAPSAPTQFDQAPTAPTEQTPAAPTVAEPFWKNPAGHASSSFDVPTFIRNNSEKK